MRQGKTERFAELTHLDLGRFSHHVLFVQPGFHRGDEFIWSEGLLNIIIGAEIHSMANFGTFTEAAQEDEGKNRSRFFAAEFLENGVRLYQNALGRIVDALAEARGSGDSGTDNSNNGGNAPDQQPDNGGSSGGSSAQPQKSMAPPDEGEGI